MALTALMLPELDQPELIGELISSRTIQSFGRTWLNRCRAEWNVNKAHRFKVTTDVFIAAVSHCRGNRCRVKGHPNGGGSQGGRKGVRGSRGHNKRLKEKQRIQHVSHITLRGAAALPDSIKYHLRRIWHNKQIRRRYIELAPPNSLCYSYRKLPRLILMLSSLIETGYYLFIFYYHSFFSYSSGPQFHNQSEIVSIFAPLQLTCPAGNLIINVFFCLTANSRLFQPVSISARRHFFNSISGR